MGGGANIQDMGLERVTVQTLLLVDACGAFASTMAETEMSSPSRSCGERDDRMVALFGAWCCGICGNWRRMTTNVCM